MKEWHKEQEESAVDKDGRMHGVGTTKHFYLFGKEGYKISLELWSKCRKINKYTICLMAVVGKCL